MDAPQLKLSVPQTCSFEFKCIMGPPLKHFNEPFPAFNVYKMHLLWSPGYADM